MTVKKVANKTSKSVRKKPAEPGRVKSKTARASKISQETTSITVEAKETQEMSKREKFFKRAGIKKKR